MTTRTFLCIIAAAAALAGQEKQKPPEGSAPKPFKVPARQTWNLDNGLTVSTVPYGRIPKVIVRGVVRVGNVNEGANEVWLADLTGDLMEEGAGSRNAAQLAESSAAMGGRLSVSVGPDQTTVNLEVLSEFAPDAIAMVADVLQRPTLPESEIARLKTDQIRRLTVARSQPQAIADELFRKALYPDHPHGRLFPTEEMIKSYTVERVREFYKKNFGAQRTSIYVAGVFDAAAVKKAVSSSFGSWAKGEPPALDPAKPVAKRELITADRPGAPQSTLRIGLPVPSPANKDYIPLQVTDSMLGGSFMSRITSNIREQKGYTYSPYSFIATHYGDAFWVHTSDVTTASTGAAMSEIFGEIEKIRREPPSQQELKGYEENLAGLFVLQNSSPAGIIGRLNFVDLHGLGDNWLNTYVQQVNAVKPADVQRIAETYLSPSKMTVVVVGDQSKIKEQLTPFRSNPTQ